jgi:hypothetical protein
MSKPASKNKTTTPKKVDVWLKTLFSPEKVDELLAAAGEVYGCKTWDDIINRVFVERRDFNVNLMYVLCPTLTKEEVITISDSILKPPSLKPSE